MPEVPRTRRASIVGVEPALRPVAAQAAVEIGAAEQGAVDLRRSVAAASETQAGAIDTIKQEVVRKVRRDMTTEENELFAAATKELDDLRIGMQNDPDPEAFQVESDRIIAEILGRATFEEVQDTLRAKLAASSERMRFGVGIGAENAAQERAVAGLQERLDALIRSFGFAATEAEQNAILQDGMVAIEAAFANGDIENDAVRFALIHRFLNGAQATAVLVGLGKDGDPVRTLEKLKDKHDPTFAGMDSIARKRAELQMQAKIDADAGKENARIEGKIKERIDRVGPDTVDELVRDINQLWDDGVYLSRSPYLADLQRVRTRMAQGAIDAGLRRDIHRVAQTGEGSVDITNPAFKKAWNDYFFQSMGELFVKAEGNAKLEFEAENKAVEMITHMGVYPSALRGRMRQTAQSGTNPTEIRRYAEIFVAVDVISPETNNAAFGREKSLLYRMMQPRLLGGADPATVVAEAVKQLRISKDAHDVLEDRWQEQFADDDSPTAKAEEEMRDMLGEIPGAFFGWTIGPLGIDVNEGPFHPQMVADFSNNWRALWMMSGDLDASRDQAFAELRMIWGMTSIGQGGETNWVRRPVDKEHGFKGSDNLWIAEHMVAETSEIFRGDIFDDPPRMSLELRAQFTNTDLARFRDEGIPADQILLESDPITQMMRPGKAAYLRSVLSDTGSWVPIQRFPGQPERWKPDFLTSPAGLRDKMLREELEVVEGETVLEAQGLRSLKGLDGPLREMSQQPQDYVTNELHGALEAEAESTDYYNEPIDTRNLSPARQREELELRLTLIQTQEELDAGYNLGLIAQGMDPLQSLEGSALFIHHSAPR